MSICSIKYIRLAMNQHGISNHSIQAMRLLRQLVLNYGDDCEVLISNTVAIHGRPRVPWDISPLCCRVCGPCIQLPNHHCEHLQIMVGSLAEKGLYLPVDVVKVYIDFCCIHGYYGSDAVDELVTRLLDMFKRRGYEDWTDNDTRIRFSARETEDLCRGTINRVADELNLSPIGVGQAVFLLNNIFRSTKFFGSSRTRPELNVNYEMWVRAEFDDLKHVLAIRCAGGW